MWKRVSPGPSVPRVRDVNEWPLVVEAEHQARLHWGSLWWSFGRRAVRL